MPSKLYDFSKRAALLLLYRLPPIPTHIRGRWVWIHPRARFSITTNTFFKGEIHVQKWLEAWLKPGSVFFDVGAHHGWVSMWGLALVGVHGKVCSFEPSPANVSILEWHRSRNKFAQWMIVPRAVSDIDVKDQDFFLIDNGDSPMNSLAARGPGVPFMSGRNIRKTSIQTASLDTFCSETGLKPNLVKIDVEGAELLVLHGAAKLLQESCPVIILAVHPYWLPEGQAPGQILDLLTNYGYRICDSEGRPATYLQNSEYLCLPNRYESMEVH